jgi:3-hydroxyisobutyrate dehydrogenase-like beta-hydroxyacid dehydrogenase
MQLKRPVTVIGLGFMGSAIARALASAGFNVCAWSRSAARRAEFSKEFYVPASAVDAVKAADVIVLCITNFDASAEFLGLAGLAEALRGKTLVQLTSESPEEARRFATLTEPLGVAVLDGAIATMPASIGNRDAVIYYSGDRALFDRAHNILAAMAGKPTYCGADPSDASSMDMAWLSLFYSAALGLIQGIAICQAARLDPSTYLNATPSYLPEILAMSKDFERQTRLDNFTGNQANMTLHLGGAAQVLAVCTAKGLDTRLPQAVVDLIQKSIDAGFAELEFAVAAKVIRPL